MELKGQREIKAFQTMLNEGESISIGEEQLEWGVCNYQFSVLFLILSGLFVLINVVFYQAILYNLLVALLFFVLAVVARVLYALNVNNASINITKDYVVVSALSKGNKQTIAIIDNEYNPKKYIYHEYFETGTTTNIRKERLNIIIQNLDDLISSVRPSDKYES